MMNEVVHELKDYPLPEDPMEPLLDLFLSNAEGLFGAASSSEGLDGGSTPVPSGEGLSQPWSERTLTGSASGRCSALSWVADEAEMDRVAAEKVRRIFSKVNAALYREKSTGTLHVDRECREWSSTFPHIEVCGGHLLDTMEDGTEMASPDLSSSSDREPVATPPADNGLQIVGTAIALGERRGGKGYVHEEIIESEGIIEEYFAFDNTADDSAEQRRRARLKPHPPHPHHHHAFPPITPNACVRDTVCNQVFDQIWTEVTSVLHPLIASIQEVSTPGRSSSYSLQVSISEHSTPQLEGQVRGGGENPLSLASQRGLPPINKPGVGPAGSQMLRVKYSNMTLPQVSPNSDVVTDLQGLMHIKSLPLQQRLSQAYMPPLPMSEPLWEEPAIILNRPESSLVTSRANTLIPPRTSDYQLPSTPAATNPSSNRLLSGRMAGRRLKPLEKPKTPAASQLVPLDDGIVRGHKLRAGLSQGSPPATPSVRNNQLPPLEGSNSLMENAKSPPTIRSGTQRSKAHVSFSSRVVSAADSQEPWRLPRPSGVELRPNTTANSFRHDPTSKSVGRKISDYSLHLGVVGYAAGIHGGDSFLRERNSATIAEDEELVDDDFTVTGTSGFFQSKPRSGRTKLPRGPLR